MKDLSLLEGKTLILSCSGGKDSAAAGLLLLELGLKFQAVFCDTGWEHPATYEYINGPLTERFGEIKTLSGGHKWPDKLTMWKMRQDGKHSQEEIEKAEIKEANAMAIICEAYAQELEGMLYKGERKSEFIRRTLQKAVFPARTLRWCTQELKFFPAKEYLANLDDPLNIVGIRAEESKSRAKMPEHEYDKGLDCDVWRPLIQWSFDDVVAIHKRHGLTPNPLYLGSASRVGCYPCIFSRKNEIRHLDKERIDVIRLLEKRVAELSEMRLKRTEGRRRNRNTRKKNSVLPPTFFQADLADASGSYFWPIDAVMDWAVTAYGGRQYELFAGKDSDAGCMRWGLCDTGHRAEETT